ncbi:hypothetical protein SAMN02910456_00043 [Ruminococcaceae bacterium YRB3002]|nr:hypothetical protein SAMN02910456_00043 [Ruminococcaceae bacterium YRB3002]
MKRVILVAAVVAASVCFVSCKDTQITMEVTSSSEDTYASDAETAAAESAAAESEVTTPSAPAEPVLEFSGDPQDIMNIGEDSYYEGENYVLFVAAGSVLTGDTPAKISEVMDSLEELYGLSYSYKGNVHEDDWRTRYFSGSFTGINRDMSKASILIIPDPHDDSIEWTYGNEVLLHDTTLSVEHGYYDGLYHELAHLLRLRQSNMLGSVMEEGVALYAQDRLSRENDYPNWSMLQYVTYGGYVSMYDDSVIYDDPEGEFIRASLAERSGAQTDYQYGFRFVMFLMENYGTDIISKISVKAREYDLSSLESVSPDEKDMRTVVEIIKSCTEDDVFAKFVKWLPSGWEAYCREYVKYIERFSDM